MEDEEEIAEGSELPKPQLILLGERAGRNGDSCEVAGRTVQGDSPIGKASGHGDHRRITALHARRNLEVNLIRAITVAEPVGVPEGRIPATWVAETYNKYALRV